MVRVIRKADLRDTARHVRSHAYETFRFLLAEDAAEATVADIVLAPGIAEIYGSDVHVEIAYCIEGEAEVTDLAGGAPQRISAGTLWVAMRGDRFRFVASQPTRLICVFVPTYVGNETGFAADAAG